MAARVSAGESESKSEVFVWFPLGIRWSDKKRSYRKKPPDAPPRLSRETWHVSRGKSSVEGGQEGCERFFRPCKEICWCQARKSPAISRNKNNGARMTDLQFFLHSFFVANVKLTRNDLKIWWHQTKTLSLLAPKAAHKTETKYGISRTERPCARVSPSWRPQWLRHMCKRYFSRSNYRFLVVRPWRICLPRPRKQESLEMRRIRGKLSYDHRSIFYTRFQAQQLVGHLLERWSELNFTGDRSRKIDTVRSLRRISRFSLALFFFPPNM